MKLEANWKFKSLDSLEKTSWGEPTYTSHLVKTVHRLRKVPLNEYNTEDLRIMVGQHIGLDFLIPLAIERLSEDLFAEGDLYEGDLLRAVLNVKSEFWELNPSLWNQVNQLINNRLNELDDESIKYSDFLSLELD
ncbi:MAG: contact-dependent growth inhibition system immunity protein [Fulvivirga sp.]